MNEEEFISLVNNYALDVVASVNGFIPFKTLSDTIKDSGMDSLDTIMLLGDLAEHFGTPTNKDAEGYSPEFLPEGTPLMNIVTWINTYGSKDLKICL